MNYHISDEESFVNFTRHMDEENCTFSFKIETSNSSGRWIYDKDSLLVSLFTKPKAQKFGEHLLSLTGYRNTMYSSPGKRIDSYQFTYSNLSWIINLETKKSKFTHLRKNNEHDITIVNDIVLVPWFRLYSEIKRISERDKNTKKEKELGKITREMRLMLLHGELGSAGLDRKVVQYPDFLDVNVGYNTMRIVLDDPKSKDMETLNYSVYFNGSSYGQVPIPKIIEFVDRIKGTFILPERQENGPEKTEDY